MKSSSLYKHTTIESTRLRTFYCKKNVLLSIYYNKIEFLAMKKYF